jgi:hypothetical protein
MPGDFLKHDFRNKGHGFWREEGMRVVAATRCLERLYAYYRSAGE